MQVSKHRRTRARDVLALKTRIEMPRAIEAFAGDAEDVEQPRGC